MDFRSDFLGREETRLVNDTPVILLMSCEDIIYELSGMPSPHRAHFFWSTDQMPAKDLVPRQSVAIDEKVATTKNLNMGDLP